MSRRGPCTGCDLKELNLLRSLLQDQVQSSVGCVLSCCAGAGEVAVTKSESVAALSGFMFWLGRRTVDEINCQLIVRAEEGKKQTEDGTLKGLGGCTLGGWPGRTPVEQWLLTRAWQGKEASPRGRAGASALGSRLLSWRRLGSRWAGAAGGGDAGNEVRAVVGLGR